MACYSVFNKENKQVRVFDCYDYDKQDRERAKQLAVNFAITNNYSLVEYFSSFASNTGIVVFENNSNDKAK